MAQHKRNKKPSEKHHPRGLIILYEDADILVVNKKNGLLTVSTDKEKEKTAFFLLNKFVKKGNSQSKNTVFIVHRLDRDTSGVLVFAKSEEVKDYLQENWAEFRKKYKTVVHGTLKEKEGIITSYLKENKAYRMYSVAKGLGKLSKTGYKVLSESNGFSLLEIDLHTGRKHQIRVHLADKGYPIAGDKEYGHKVKAVSKLALHAASMTIRHPFTKEEMTFNAAPPEHFKVLLSK